MRRWISLCGLLLLLLETLGCVSEQKIGDDIPFIKALPRGESVLVWADGNMYVVNPQSGDIARWLVAEVKPTRDYSGLTMDWSETRQELLLHVGDKILAISPDGRERPLPLQAPPDLRRPLDGMGHFAWSPDGKQVAFRIYIRDKNGKLYYGLYSQDAAGSPPKALARYGEAPSWSPDGMRIAFLDSGRQSVRSVSPDGTEPSVFLSVSKYSEFPKFGAPHWSPDGKSLQIIKNATRLDSSIQILNIATGNLVEIFSHHSEFNGAQVAWSPGSTELVLSSTKGSSCRFNPFNAGPGGPLICDNERIYKLNADGSELTRLANREFGYVTKLLWVRVR